MNTGGKLAFNINGETLPMSVEDIAIITRLDVDTVIVGMTLLKQLGLVSETDGVDIIPDVNSMIGSETDAAIRMRKMREKKFKNGSVRISREMIRLPNGKVRYVDEKRYGGNGMIALDKSKGKCEKCGSDENIVIHHSNGYSNELKDLICLCKKCHLKLHRSV